MIFSRPRRTPPEIALTSLIDIMFIVLIFLFLTATFSRTTTFQVSLPAASTGETDRGDRADRIVVAVAADGTIDLNGDIVTLVDLEGRLQAYPDRDRVSLILRADERASHGVVVGVMDRIRRAGILRLSLDTRPAARMP